MTVEPVTLGNILIVDDIIENIRILTDIMREEGHRVRHALSGDQALQAIQEQNPDLVLLDIMMPGMDGYEICRRIKANADTADIPVIFLSARQETKDILRGFNAGGVDFIGKPFQVSEVVVRVENQLTLARQRNELIQQRREIQTLRQKDQQRFDELSAMKDEFLHAAAHDLRNPLTTISLYCQMLESETDDGPVDPAAVMQITNGIRNSTKKMQDLITDILDLAKLQIGIDLNTRETVLQSIIQKSVRNFALIADEADIDLQHNLPTYDILVSVDRPRMERVFDNLIANAIKYTPGGGCVTVEMHESDDEIRVHIHDDGIGIPDSDLSRLFDPFYRVKSKLHREHTGTGLGLSIVKTIVQQHSGYMSVSSDVNTGSTFTVHLPIYT